jgi:hypothetical protein
MIMTHCYDCKNDYMINILHLGQTCKTDKCYVRAYKESYKGYCTRCFIHNFPNEKTAQNYKIKERYIIDHVTENFSDLTFINDKRVQGGCSKRRPDMFVDLLTHVLIIEIDENQHNDYDLSCEELRLNELFEDFAYRNLVFSRFNPDKYVYKGEKKPGCFRIHKQTGIQVIDNQALFSIRMRKLESRIKYHMENIPSETITEYLYYDVK